MDFLLIALLTLLNGAFAMSELALTASRKVRLTTLSEAGDPGAKAALVLLDNPTRFLSTVQVGITSIGMLNAIVGEAAFSGTVADWLESLGVSAKLAAVVATGLVVTAITFITIVFGELVPKRIGQLYPEPVARIVARPMTLVASVAKPFVWLLSACTTALLRLLRVDTDASRAVTEEEISASLEEGVDAGLIEEHEHQMVQNVFGLDDRPLTSVMRPRSDVDWLEAGERVPQALRAAGVHGGHSVYPVCRGSLDDVVGTVGLGTLLQASDTHDGTIESLAVPAVYVPETLSVMELVAQFRQRSTRMVFVVDEYGVVQGLITPGDLLEAITGELQPETQVEAWATERPDGSWLIDGAMPVSELKARLDIEELPDEDRGLYNTVAGLLMAVSGHLPVTAERITCAGWLFEVVDLDGRRIDKLLATRMAPVSDASAD